MARASALVSRSSASVSRAVESTYTRNLAHTYRLDRSGYGPDDANPLQYGWIQDPNVIEDWVALTSETEADFVALWRHKWPEGKLTGVGPVSYWSPTPAAGSWDPRNFEGWTDDYLVHYSGDIYEWDDYVWIDWGAAGAAELMAAHTQSRFDDFITDHGWTLDGCHTDRTFQTPETIQHPDGDDPTWISNWQAGLVTYFTTLRGTLPAGSIIQVNGLGNDETKTTFEDYVDACVLEDWLKTKTVAWAIAMANLYHIGLIGAGGKGDPYASKAISAVDGADNAYYLRKLLTAEAPPVVTRAS